MFILFNQILRIMLDTHKIYQPYTISLQFHEKCRNGTSTVIYRVVAIIRRNSSGASKNEFYEISRAPSDPPGLGLDPQQFSLTYHP